MSATALTQDQRMAAYELVKETFGLKWRQRDALDASPFYGEILEAAHANDLVAVAVLLDRAGIA